MSSSASNGGTVAGEALSERERVGMPRPEQQGRRMATGDVAASRSESASKFEWTPRRIAAYNHARCHDLSRPIDKCWRCRWIIWRETKRA